MRILQHDRWYKYGRVSKERDIVQESYADDYISLIAIMLGRLRMSVEECICAYIELSSRVFQKKHVIPVTIRGKVKARYSSKELQRAIENVVTARHLDKDTLLKDTSPQACKVFVMELHDGLRR